MDDLELAPEDLAPGPAAPVEWGEMEEPRVPARLYALKDRDARKEQQCDESHHGTSVFPDFLSAGRSSSQCA